MEDSSGKAKIHYKKLPKGYGWDPDDEDCDESKLGDPETLTASDCGCPEARFGDIINFGDYRSISAYVVGKGGKLIKNPDNSGSGYMSIPFEITQFLTNAHSMYGDDDEVNDVDLRHDDEFLKNWFIDLPEELHKCKFNWSYPVDILAITFPSGLSKEFERESHTLEDVMRAYELCMLPRCRVTVEYNIANEEFVRFAKKHSPLLNIDEVLKQLAEVEKKITDYIPEESTNKIATAPALDPGAPSAPVVPPYTLFGAIPPPLLSQPAGQASLLSQRYLLLLFRRSRFRRLHCPQGQVLIWLDL